MEPISLKEYHVSNHAQDINDILKAWVNYEERDWFKNEKPPELPKYIRPKVEKGKVGWWNFFINCIIELTP